jgi:hypothetical protein
MQLPTELWLLIFDIVIEEGIIRVDQCDHTKFPYIQFILSNRHHAHDSYYRLRLVCRSFKAILGDRPSCKWPPSSRLPLSSGIRALILHLGAWPGTDLQLLPTEAQSFRRVVYLDVTFGRSQSPGHPNVFDFFRACAGRAFHNVRRLALRILNSLSTPDAKKSLWVPLQDAFPLLVTLVITGGHTYSRGLMPGATDTVASLEWLEILYLGCEIRDLGCSFPRLRQASIWNCSQYELETLTASPNLESLFIRSFHSCVVDMNRCLQLKLLGIYAEACDYVNPPASNHHLEYLWIFIYRQTKNYQAIEVLLSCLPRILRVTIDLSSVARGQARWRITEEFQGINFGSMGLKLRPPVDGGSLLIIERESVGV